MTPLDPDCFAAGDAPMTLAAAQDLVARLARPVATVETVPFAAALGRILAENVIAAVDVPGFDNAAVDGYALAAADLAPAGETRLPVAGRAAAGHPLATPHSPGTTVRILTGAAVPPGCDTVVMQEDCRLEGATVVLPAGVRPGSHVRRAGEDVRAGTPVLAAGTRLDAAGLALAAAAGRAALAVRARLGVAVLSTGDEVREPGRPLGPGALYDSNRAMLVALLAGLGFCVTDLGIVPDDARALRLVLEGAAKGHDLILASGGVSVGEEDHVRGVVASLGTLHAWRVAVKPGRPVAFGQVGRVPFVGLPGNPAAALVTFLMLARPLALGLAGAAPLPPRGFPVRAAFAYNKRLGRREFLRARLAVRDGLAAAERVPGDGALSGLVAADGLVDLPEDAVRVAEGDPVVFIPLGEALR